MPQANTGSEEAERTFPFGRAVEPRPPSATEPRPVYLLGAYPSGLHVGWTSPNIDGHPRRSIKAIIVDNEPTPFWDGSDEHHWLSEWMKAVSWKEKPWGIAALPPPGTNGSSGRWVNEHILEPLRLHRDEVCISDCLDTARLNKSQKTVLARAYQPVAPSLDLPECTMLPGPGEADIVREAEQHHERLRQELRRCQPSKVITLGNAALRVMRVVLDNGDDHDADGGPARSGDERPQPQGPQSGGLIQEGYGEPVTVAFDDEPLTWLPLLHPGQRARTWRDVRDRWEQAHRAGRRG